MFSTCKLTKNKIYFILSLRTVRGINNCIPQFNPLFLLLLLLLLLLCPAFLRKILPPKRLTKEQIARLSRITRVYLYECVLNKTDETPSAGLTGDQLRKLQKARGALDSEHLERPK